LTQQSVGSAQLNPNQILETNEGKAELLLTPGVFLRIGNTSEIRMASARLTDTEVELLRGSAMVEAAEVFKDSNIRVLDSGTAVRLEKSGLYEFTAGPGAHVAVYDGQAEVDRGDQHLKLKKGKELDLGGPLRAHKFDRDQHDELYAWSSLRSEYSSEASLQSARTVFVNNGWSGPGWYWTPSWDMYAYLPGDGILYSPFGWGFYSPWWGFYGPVYGIGYGYGNRFFHGGRHWTSGGAFRGRGPVGSAGRGAIGGFGGHSDSFGARGFSGMGGLGSRHGMGGGHR
jgi:hypothetical protein